LHSGRSRVGGRSGCGSFVTGRHLEEGGDYFDRQYG
jgi:hypothetical protein